MRIKRLQIKSFGKLKNINLELKPGLNVIYGSNEAGKSTMQHFIKAMLYGMNSMKKTIRENDRRRFLPWDGGTAQGILVFEEENKSEYVIDRSFGQTKKEDNYIIYNSVTGEKAVHIDNYQPGKDIFGLGEDAFEKTLFIKQLGAKVAMDKEDEIMKKLLNLHESGEEDISYNKAKAALDSYKKQLRNSRKNGKIEDLEEKIQRLMLQRNELHKLQDENIEDSQRLKIIAKRIEEVEKEIDGLEKEKSSLKADNIYQEAEDAFKKSFYDGEIKEGETLLQKAEQLYFVYKERVEALKYSEDEKNKLKLLIEEKETELRGYEGFNSLGEDIELKLNNLAIEKRELEERLRNIDNLQTEIEALQDKSNYMKSQADGVAKHITITTDEENQLLRLEERQKELIFQVEAAKLKDTTMLKEEILRDRKGSSLLISCIGLTLSSAGIWGGISGNLPALLLGALGVLTAVYGFLQYKKVSYKLSQLKVFRANEGNADKLLKEKEEVDNLLRKIYKNYEVNSYSELKIKLDSSRDILMNIESVSIRTAEKQRMISNLKGQEAAEALARINKNYEFLCNHCRCSNMESFEKNLKIYKELTDALKNLVSQYNVKKAEVMIKNEQLIDIMEQLKGVLARFNKTNVMKADNYEEYIAAIRKEFEDLRYIRQQAYEGYNEERDSLEIKLKNLNKELSELREHKKDIQHNIELRFKDKPSLWSIEEEIQRCYEGKLHFEKLYSCAEIADQVLNEAFEELQRNFAPKLNNEVGNIINRITKGKYKEVRVSADYEINVIDEFRLRELDYLSGGTFDQVYFALRLALCNTIFENKKVPIFLDDAFIQYDEERLENTLDFLKEFAKERQVIVFTCRKLPEIDYVNIADLA